MKIINKERLQKQRKMGEINRKVLWFQEYQVHRVTYSANFK